MTPKQTEVAIAILYRDGHFLMQLRDNIPGIVYPGCWGFFGGHLESNETPAIAVQRELKEEIGDVTFNLSLFASYRDTTVVRHVFQGPLTVPISQLILGEGWDLGLLSVEDIQRGRGYSERAGQARPICRPHQRILADFLSSPVATLFKYASARTTPGENCHANRMECDTAGEGGQLDHAPNS